MSKMVSVARFLTREQAEVARSVLVDAGIEATVSADDTGGLIPTSMGVDVMVMEEHAAAARVLIEPEDRSDAVDAPAE